MSLVENPAIDLLLPKPKMRKIDPAAMEQSQEDPSSDLLNKAIQQLMIREALAITKRVNSQTSWLEHKKLNLVLDLDHTLVHTIRTQQLSESDKYLADEADSRNDLWRFHSGGSTSDILIKLRPFLHQFLKEASEMFSMSVYTKGGCDYARLVLDLIDPDKTYFGDRVISRRESPGVNKTLDLVLADERGIVIVDDTLSVWPHHKKNLVQIARYEYFSESSLECDEKKKMRDESEEKGALAKVLRFLKEVHRGFFWDMSEEEIDSMDVRPLLQDPSSITVERKRKIPADSVFNGENRKKNLESSTY
ncbi:Haloacid dehalogenase-like hydrolase (HAD) superfamily protein [Raphanus sativus]|uniref:RNA polymerase II C-terminal domain phosphatase-like n=1 Tax=Raphanus sativus TaxID=3726 RepID=A0A6J0K045_RAPSA|nr:RNA polymerase II C-terminal domain phosphatase-like 5 [Raphanus sativus]KAJ4887438.1 Haloacid dehalogenase-like hydrolase (HAD) superfamily protein [Raphanus sativus]